MVKEAEDFQGALQVAPGLVLLWRGLGALAWASLAWIAAWGDWSVIGAGMQPTVEAAARAIAFLAGSWLIWRCLARRPLGLTGVGKLEWRAGRARFESADSGEWRGQAEVVWRSTVMVGVCIHDPVAGRLTLWLTPRRLGATGWWRLQRFMVLGATGGG
ncbi:MAG: hypothetical protein ACQER6_02730 [Pseudomonadota bacterium]